MSQISYQEFEARREQAANQNQQPRVSYFSLKNDKDEAVVRIMHDSPADFEIVAVHPISIGGKFRKVNCLRGAYEPIENCPFCAAEKQLQRRIYIHLLEYTKDENGNIVCTPKVWERSTDYISKLKNLCDEYPPLSDSLFKIKRNGAAGSMETTYDIMFASPAVYNPNIYVKDENAFKNYSCIGSAVLNKTPEEMIALISGNEAVAKQSEPVNASNETVVNESTVRTYNPGVSYSNTESSDESVVRPRRIY